VGSDLGTYSGSIQFSQGTGFAYLILMYHSGILNETWILDLGVCHHLLDDILSYIIHP